MDDNTRSSCRLAIWRARDSWLTVCQEMRTPAHGHVKHRPMSTHAHAWTDMHGHAHTCTDMSAHAQDIRTHAHANISACEHTHTHTGHKDVHMAHGLQAHAHVARHTHTHTHTHTHRQRTLNVLGVSIVIIHCLFQNDMLPGKQPGLLGSGKETACKARMRVSALGTAGLSAITCIVSGSISHPCERPWVWWWAAMIILCMHAQTHVCTHVRTCRLLHALCHSALRPNGTLPRKK